MAIYANKPNEELPSKVDMARVVVQYFEQLDQMPPADDPRVYAKLRARNADIPQQYRTVKAIIDKRTSHTFR